MSNFFKKGAIYILFGLVTSGFTMDVAGAQSVKLASASSMEVISSAKAPMGWLQFCKAQPEECATKPMKPVKAKLSAARIAELDRVNRRINAEIAPVTDQELYGVEELWTYPSEAKGDCEDYVLLKRRTLIEAGWPRQALLITVVRDLKGDGHAVLTVVTDRGDYALDNQADDVKPWFETGYTFVKRQSQSDPNQWVLLGDGVNPIGVAAAP
ncbi:transglutaminase [Methylopila turkensis]|uniref:Transglutaminase n=2 Tax=Methylopila turkensis TaxID=1437816 RepID=A0A9W6JT54_9HYPH|nr:transglutaminase [Methylopila turkensis]